MAMLNNQRVGWIGVSSHSDDQSWVMLVKQCQIHHPAILMVEIPPIMARHWGWWIRFCFTNMSCNFLRRRTSRWFAGERNEAKHRIFEAGYRFRSPGGQSDWGRYGSGSKPIVPLVNIKIAGKWMFIPLKMVLIGIDYWFIAICFFCGFEKIFEELWEDFGFVFH